MHVWHFFMNCWTSLDHPGQYAHRCSCFSVLFCSRLPPVPAPWTAANVRCFNSNRTTACQVTGVPSVYWNRRQRTPLRTERRSHCCHNVFAVKLQTSGDDDLYSRLHFSAITVRHTCQETQIELNSTRILSRVRLLITTGSTSVDVWLEPNPGDDFAHNSCMKPFSLISSVLKLHSA